MTAHKPLFAGYTEFKTVADLETGLEPGWDLLQVIPSQKLQEVREDIGVDPSVVVPTDQYNSCNTSGGMSVSGTRNYVINCTLFLLGRNKDDTLARLKGDLVELTGIQGALDVKNEELEKQVKVGKIAIQQSQKHYEVLDTEAKRTREEIVKARNRNLRMENDIAKLREHFGKKAVDEALGDEKADG